MLYRYGLLKETPDNRINSITNAKSEICRKVASIYGGQKLFLQM